MGQDLVEIHPRELHFTFGVKKLSSCNVRLVNNSNKYVAFKVKTTSPKRYFVQPNTGVILPRKTRDFTVTMQALRTAPPDMQLKDKFLVLTTVVPYGTSDEDLIPAFFSKETGRYIDDSKLRVVLVRASDPLEEQPINEFFSTDPAIEVSVPKEMPDIENGVLAVPKEVPNPLEQTPVVMTKIPSPVNETYVTEDVQNMKSKLNNLESKLEEAEKMIINLREESRTTTQERDKVQEEMVTEDVQNMKSKLNNLESKLEEAEKMIIKLREESRTTTQERDKLQEEMVCQKKKGTPRNQVGFPLLFVVYVALLGILLRYLLRL